MTPIVEGSKGAPGWRDDCKGDDVFDGDVAFFRRRDGVRFNIGEGKETFGERGRAMIGPFVVVTLCCDALVLKNE